jgi:hypothetical protein
VGYENEKVSVSKYFETGGFTNILPHGKKRVSATAVVQNTSKLAFYFCIIFPHGNKRVGDCFLTPTQQFFPPPPPPTHLVRKRRKKTQKSSVPIRTV